VKCLAHGRRWGTVHAPSPHYRQLLQEKILIFVALKGSEILFPTTHKNQTIGTQLGFVLTDSNKMEQAHSA